jgi:hypothetical protein
MARTSRNEAGGSPSSDLSGVSLYLIFWCGIMWRYTYVYIISDLILSQFEKGSSNPETQLPVPLPLPLIAGKYKATSADRATSLLIFSTTLQVCFHQFHFLLIL